MRIAPAAFMRAMTSDWLEWPGMAKWRHTSWRQASSPTPRFTPDRCVKSEWQLAVAHDGWMMAG